MSFNKENGLSLMDSKMIVNRGTSQKNQTQPLTSLIVLSIIAAVPAPVRAQLPTFTPIPPTEVNTEPSTQLSVPEYNPPGDINTPLPVPDPAANTGINTVPVRQLPACVSVNSTGINTTPVEEAYLLGAGDQVRVDVFDVPEYSGEFRVLVDGTLNLPAIGNISVQGSTIPDANARITRRYNNILKRPLVTITLVAARPMTIALAGEISRPGSYTIPLTDENNFPKLTEAVNLAGGITRAAAVREVRLRRRNAAPCNVNLWDLFQNGNLSQDISLRDGDEIFIPTTITVDTVENTLLATASFSPEETRPVKIAVVGEVERPGPYIVSGTTDAVAEGGGPGDPPRIAQALQAAGGVTQLADMRNIQVQRLTKSGSQQIINIDLWQLLKGGDFSQNILLQEGDLVSVPTAQEPFADELTEIADSSLAPEFIEVNVVGEVDNPGVVEVRPNAPLNDAILAAGGFDKVRANRSSVELIRLNRNGTVQKRKISVDFESGVNEETNPPLRPDDIVVINRSGLTSFTDTVGQILDPLDSLFNIFDIFRGFSEGFGDDDDDDDDDDDNN
ncbi:MAG: sugar ABC transporter substrate-binding protein [Symploca sp. SIO2G7]|nr:sugar ABC transporter substrate-binding protein [Symploca sp. SIO2G7]